jgi:hypothetical protein
VADGSVLLKRLYPRVESALSIPSNVKALKALITGYIDKNILKLSTSGPVHRVTFLQNEIGGLFNILVIRPEDVSAILKDSPYIKSQWRIMNNPFNATAAFCIRYFALKRNKEMEELMVTYFTLSMYPSLQYKYFKYEPNENIMNATINDMSNKFKVKRTKSIYDALMETTFLANQTMGKRLIRATDKDITDYVQAFKTRLNSLIRKIANLFYENEKKGKYLNLDRESYDQDDYQTADNDTQLTERLSDAVSMKLSVNGPNMQLIRISAKMSEVSENDLRTTVNGLCGDMENRNDIKSVTSAILYLYLCNDQNKAEMIRSNDFIYYCLNIYKKANTTDKNIILIKTILDKWLTRYSASFKKTNRVATLNNFRRALFTFFVFTIQQSQ